MFNGLTNLKLEKINLIHIFINQKDKKTPLVGLHFYSPIVPSYRITRFYNKVKNLVIKRIKVLLKQFILKSKKAVNRTFKLLK